MTTIKTRLLSDQNIFLSLYLVDSYISNRELLDAKDRIKLYKIKDVFDKEYITAIINEVRETIKNILDKDEEYFEINVYFKPKKYENKPVFRPLHTSDLISQIAMIAMLQILIYDIDETGKLIPSEISRLIPANFYGNRVSFNGKQLFKPWQEQYHEYTSKANQLLNDYCETLEYKYEVSLDLENFFPSVDPCLLYSYIHSKLPLNLSTEDLNTIKIIIKKLLFFKLPKLKKQERKWYLGDAFKEGNEDETVEKCSFAKGIPQGLPHTYFIANIYMLLIKQSYEHALCGEMLFYVDDSVVFTNGKDGILDESNFQTIIDSLNNQIKQQEESLRKSSDNFDFKPPSEYKYVQKDFGVKVHDNGGKSTFSEITNVKENSGELYLRGLSRETSNIGFDMYTTYSDEEIHMLNSRTSAIIELVDKELNRVRNYSKNTKDNANKKFDQYEKKLLRCKKFFSYRQTILDYKDKGSVKQLKQKIMEDIKIRCDEDSTDLENFFSKYTEDIMAASIDFVFKRCIDKDIDVNDLIGAVKKMNECLYNGNVDHSYISKAYEIYLNKNIEYYDIDIYKSIHRAISLKYRSICEQSQKNKYNHFETNVISLLIEDFNKNNDELSSNVEMHNIMQYKDLYDLLGFQEFYEYSYYIRSSNNEFERMLLNGIFSYIFEYKIDNSFNLSKTSKHPMEYAEVRMLILLRNKYFDINNFMFSYKEYTKDEYRQTIDYSILQVLDIFRTLVSHPKRIDDLILIHKYCCDTWKNGSKYLHFYTLHNQEHAVSLIRNSIKVLHAISYFTLKKIDYFILFASCYLHDISMVTLPDMSKFYIGSNEKADCIYTDFINELDVNNSVKMKKQLCDVYQDIDSFFESTIRDSHAYQSAQEIRMHGELGFLEPSIREFIADVSEGHGYDTTDIYYLKSTGKETLINKKLIMIILRLCDLLDMSRYRISNVILNHNLKNLNAVSRFHWLSHLITDGYQLENAHIVNSSIKTKSFLQNKNITEKILLTVDVLMSQTTAVKCVNACRNIDKCELCLDSQSEKYISLRCVKGETCKSPQCSFLCKWFIEKNKYLIDELGELSHYLNTIQDNYFASEVEIRIRVVSNTNIPNDIFDYIREYID